MAELIIVGYPDTETANEALETLRQLERDLSLRIGGAAVVVKSADGDVEMITPTFSTSQGAVFGSFWGVVIGVLFTVPVGGAIVGGIVGGIVGTVKGWGIEDDVRAEAADVLKPGGAAVVAFVSDVIPDEAMAALAPLGGEVLRTSLSEDAEAEIQRSIDAERSGRP